MNLNFKIRRFTKDAEWLCFRHAVQRANKGEHVVEDIDDFTTEYYMGRTTCVDCELELEQRVHNRNKERKKKANLRWSKKL